MLPDRIISRLTALLFLLFIGMQSALAAENDDVCSPFKNAQIDQSLITTMLNAAKKGQLYQVKDNQKVQRWHRASG